MTTVRSQGRFAGATYLGVVLTGIFTLAYAPGRLIVTGDPAATAAAISANPGLFTAANYAALAMSALFFLALPFALSRFLSPHGAKAARLMVVLVAASIPLTLAAVAQSFGLAHLVRTGGASVGAVAEKLSTHDRWMEFASIFWGLWLAPLGWLILKSGAIPRAFGLLLIAGCAGYLANFSGPALYEGYDDLSFRSYISTPGTIGEIGTCLWLLVFGARGSPLN